MYDDLYNILTYVKSRNSYLLAELQKAAHVTRCTCRVGKKVLRCTSWFLNSLSFSSYCLQYMMIYLNTIYTYILEHDILQQVDKRQLVLNLAQHVKHCQS